MTKKKIKKFLLGFLLFIIILNINLFFRQPENVFALDAKDSKLIEKISKDYTKKFCNSIGFGLSKESAMKFSYNENKEIFKNRKGFENINKELLSQKIAYSVVDGCGYQLDLYEDKDIEDFAEYYLSFYKER